ncbi:hypothetical protein, conserved [Eimeria tenella]|uniref:Uncharacterized protein n=1 Tax=Eimeria tenella TaxID=5802 RepID=U6L2J2_EIMTE|nr:hypothetical protein, conserved [Eimeria tenella]CDJ42834.1 hypothetical protein, conserved [Eimeria tenella]|eukprot:XP_013233584.1 hypothetical protein, conserved [Eimeria tenella]
MGLVNCVEFISLLLRPLLCVATTAASDLSYQVEAVRLSNSTLKQENEGLQEKINILKHQLGYAPQQQQQNLQHQQQELQQRQDPQQQQQQDLQQQRQQQRDLLQQYQQQQDLRQEQQQQQGPHKQQQQQAASASDEEKPACAAAPVEAAHAESNSEAYSPPLEEKKQLSTAKAAGEEPSGGDAA